jgi:RsiW-degrading membrane proteinase PrsW (M82 family)
MLAVAMAFAAVWGVVQLAVLGWGTRTVRLGTLLLATAAGAFACGAIAIAAELAYTRAVAAVTGDSVAAVVRSAGQTVDPFLEEVAKILPLVVAALHLRTRRQWGLTDFLLLGAAAGAGFALLEAVLRFGHQAAHATRVADGWVLPTSLFPPHVPDPLAVLASWLPAPANTEFIGSLGEGTGTNLHLVWSAVAGLGVGLWFRLRGHVRWVGPALVLLAGADHASANYDVVPTPGTTLGDVLSAPFRAGQPLVWLWPLLALAAAVVLDVRTLRAARAVAPFPRLRGEGTGTGAVRGLARYAALHPPWTSFLVLRFVALRRASLYGCADGVAPESEPMLGVVADVRARMDVADHPAAWTGVGLRRVSLGPDEADRTPAGVLRRFWPVLLWLVLLLPAVLYFLAGTTPSLAGVQDWLERPGVFGAVVAVPAGFALVLLAWQVVTGIHVLPGVFREASGELPAIVQLRVGTALGASLIGVLGVSAWLTGTNPARPLMSAFHAVEALDSLLLVGALALVLAAFLVFPPAIGLTVVGSGPGTTVLVPTVALSSGFATLTVLGTSGVMLSQAVGNSGGDPRPVGGSGSVPDLPRRPTPAKPPVHHWRLRRIVDDLWHGTENPHRIGDGTVMDAVLNEVLTGRPTHGRFHLDKARQAVDRITNWVDEYGNSASRTDRTHAWELRDQLQRALEGR